jgi:hypothetical protein
MHRFEWARDKPATRSMSPGYGIEDTHPIQGARSAFRGTAESFVWLILSHPIILRLRELSRLSKDCR